MTSSEDIRAALADLPPDIRNLLDEFGISPYVDHLLEALEPGHVPEQERAFLHSYLDWMLYVFATAQEPLASGTLATIRDGTSQLSAHVESTQWDDIRDRLLPPLLYALSSIPARRFRHATDLAEFDRTRESALRKIARSRREAQKAQETTEADLKKSQTGFEAKVTERLTAIAEEARGYSKQLAEMLEVVRQEGSEASTEIRHLLEKLQNEYGFVASQVLGEAHGKAAAVAKSDADAHKKRARHYSLWAAVAAGIILIQDRLANVLGWTNDWDQWFDVFRSLPVLGSPVAILIFLAVREGQSAKSSSAAHVRLQHLELQIKSWEPYLSTLSEETRARMEETITPKLFVGDVATAHPPAQE